jgi:hypothetical protein
MDGLSFDWTNTLTLGGDAEFFSFFAFGGSLPRRVTTSHVFGQIFSFFILMLEKECWMVAGDTSATLWRRISPAFDRTLMVRQPTPGRSRLGVRPRRAFAHFFHGEFFFFQFAHSIKL